MSRNKNFLPPARRRRLDAGPADSFGSERAFGYNGEEYTSEYCEALVELLPRRGFRSDVLLSVERMPWHPEALANSLDKLMRKFARWWGRRHAVGPDREPLWLDYFIVCARSEGGHASHGHILLTVEPTPEDERKLNKLAAKWGLEAAKREAKQMEERGLEVDERALKKLAVKLGLKIEVTGNDDAWLEERGLAKHKYKIEYAVNHLLAVGSTYRVSRAEVPAFLGKSWRRLRAATCRGRLPEAAGPAAQVAATE